MPIKIYLAVSYGLSFVMLVLAGAMISATDPDIGFPDWLIFAGVCATANTFINIWPKARRVPLENRLSFWSYRWSNIFNLGLPGTALLIGAIIFLVDTMSKK